MCNPIEGCFSVLKARINNFLSLSHEVMLDAPHGQKTELRMQLLDWAAERFIPCIDLRLVNEMARHCALSVAAAIRSEPMSYEVIKEALETVPATERTSYRAILAATRIHRTTLARPTANKDGLQRVTGSVLTSDQMHKRIEFALSFVENAFGTFSWSPSVQRLPRIAQLGLLNSSQVTRV
ncbi:hypothetical protein PC111_g3319 [Phytophthora cactorum]|nr:hypothetical protein PC111_g3319 [Phytophthora cactorum]